MEFDRWASRGCRILTVLGSVILAGLVLLGRPFHQTAVSSLSSVEADTAYGVSGLRLPEIPTLSRLDWSIFEGGGEPSSVGNRHALTDRFRLAGTFFTYGGSADAPPFRKAILDDLQLKEQRLVGEGDRFDTLRVERIEKDRVILLVGSEVVTLGLSSPGGESTQASASPDGGPDGGEPGESDVWESSAYGDRVSPDRWMLRRDALVAYYQEMLNEPERVALLYETFKPLYTDGKIAGYRLGIEGEKDFLSAMGLLENDVVRSVNSMEMTSQGRAEFFLREFMQGNISAVVMDLERDGKPVKQVYLIR